MIILRCSKFSYLH